MSPGPRPRVDTIATVAAALITLMLCGVIARVAQLQARPGDRLGASVQARQARRPIAPVRGSIYDRRFRPLAITEFGRRIFIDPVDFPAEPDEAIAVLADALGARPDTIGEQIIPRLAENERRRRALESLGPHDEPASGSPAWLALVQLASDQDGNGVEAAEPQEPAPTSPLPPEPLPLIRYVRITDVVPDEVVTQVRRLKIPGVHVEEVPVRRYPAGALAASIVGKVGSEHAGLLGAEFAANEELRGQQGRIQYVRDARGRPLWMDPESYQQAHAGGDLRLTIDLELQRMAMEELGRGIEEADAAGGRLIMLDAQTGEILAMLDVIRPVAGLSEFTWADASGRWTPPARGTRFRVIKPDPGRATHPALGRNRCVEDVYEPGSAFKPFVWATVLESGKVSPGEVFDTHGGEWTTPWRRPLKDVVQRPRMTWADVLLLSSNIGMVQGAQRLSHQQLSDGLRRYGFGRTTGVGLPGESGGIVTPLKSWTIQTQTSVAFGAEVAVTPLQMARAFAVFAREGAMAGTLPAVRLIAPERDDPGRTFVHRIVQPRTISLVREILAEVAHKMEIVLAGKHPHENAWRYRIFGKSGTAKIALGKPPVGRRLPPGHKGYYEGQYYSSFIAAGPLEQPRLVILTIIDDPGPRLVAGNVYYGSHVAGPVVRRLMDRSLAYLGVPPSPMPSLVKAGAAATTGD